MLIKVSDSFPVSPDELRSLYDQILGIDFSDLGSHEIQFGSEDLGSLCVECTLLTDSWDQYKPSTPQSPGLLGCTNGTLGIGSVWIKPGMPRDVTIRVLVHELSHLVANSLWNDDDDNFLLDIPDGPHGKLFESAYRLICHTLGMKEPRRGANLASLRSCYPGRD
jgi:hypothetical protein